MVNNADKWQWEMKKFKKVLFLYSVESNHISALFRRLEILGLKHFFARWGIIKITYIFHYPDSFKMNKIIKLLFACAILFAFASCSSSYKACAAYSQNNPTVDQSQVTAQAETSILKNQ